MHDFSLYPCSDAEVHLLDTGHFARATHADAIAEAIVAFHAKHAA